MEENAVPWSWGQPHSQIFTRKKGRLSFELLIPLLQNKNHRQIGTNYEILFGYKEAF